MPASMIDVGLGRSAVYALRLVLLSWVDDTYSWPGCKVLQAYRVILLQYPQALPLEPAELTKDTYIKVSSSGIWNNMQYPIITR